MRENIYLKLLSHDYWLGPNSIWNYLQLLGYTSSIAFSVMDMISLMNNEHMFFFSSLSLFIAWFNIFYLMRMIKATSFFIKMI